ADRSPVRGARRGRRAVQAPAGGRRVASRSMIRTRPIGAPDRRHLWWMYLGFGALVCALYVFVSPLKGSGPVINGLGLYGVLGIVAGIRIHRPRAHMAWWCFAAGLCLFWL